MADLRDPNVALQIMTGWTTGHRVPAEQISGTQTGYVLDNDVTNPVINPPGTCSVVVASFSPSTRLGPVPYPGTLVPPGGGLPGPAGPGGTQCIVSFTPPSAQTPSAMIGQIVSFVSWPPVGGPTNPPTNESTPGQQFFNSTLGEMEYFNGVAWIPVGSGGSSLLPIYVAA